MIDNTSFPPAAQAEINELRRRLTEAEDTLRAIHSGEIDALVVTTRSGDKIFTLEGADQTYRVILETMNEGTVTLDAGGTILFSNNRFSELVGFPIQKVIGSSFEQFVSESERPSFRQHLQEGLQNRSRSEFSLHSALKSLVFVVLSFSPLMLESQSTCIIVTDITEAKRTTQALRQSEETLAWLNAIQESAMLIDREGSILAVNAITGLRMQRPANELPGLCLYDLFPSQTARSLREHIAQVIDLGQPISFEAETSGRVIDSMIYPLFDPDGKVQRLALLRTDVTERKQVLEKIHRYSERLALINRLEHVITSSLEMDKVHDAIIAETQKLFTFDRSSIMLLDTACENYQIIRQWTSEKSVFPLKTWFPVQGSAVEWVVEHRQLFLEKYLGEQVDGPELKFLREEAIQSRVLLPLILQSQMIGLLSFASRQPAAYSEDDFELLQTLAGQMAIAVQNAKLYAQAQLTAEDLEERVRVRTAQLQQANKDLESFSYTVSHDLRTPLRGITGFAQILASDYKKSLDADGQHYLDRVIEGSLRMGLLIDNLLEYARVGRSGIQHHLISVEEVLTTVLHDLESQMAETQAVISLPPAGSLPIVDSDMTLLMQIFSNLLENALTYHRPGIPPKVEIIYQEESDAHLIGIRDNGIGISSNYYGKIFNVFERLHQANAYHGTGIGLAIVKKAVDLHNGQIWVDSTEGQGSTFWIKFPKP